MSGPGTSSLETNDAGFFESLLNLERTANEQGTLPGPLLEVIATLLRCIDQEGIEPPRTKPNILQRSSIMAIGTASSAIAFEEHTSGIHNVIVMSEAAVIFFACLLLGQSKGARANRPSRIESQIVLRFFANYFCGFSLVENLHKSISWSSYMAATLPFTKMADSPFFMILAYRRDEAAKPAATSSLDLKQQQQLRRAIGNGLIDVDYVLNAGQLPLATLRNLKPGSVLPFAAQTNSQVEARANGTPVLSGSLGFAAGQMRISITKLLTGDAASK